MSLLYCCSTRLPNEGIVQASSNRKGNNRPPTPDDLLVRETHTNIPHQMPYAIEAVKEEGKREEGLQSHLDNRWPSGNSCHHGLRLEVPSERGRGEVRDAEYVEGAGKSDSSDAIEATGEPGDLWAVDGKVGRDGSLETLLGEDFLALRLRSGFSGCESATLH